MFVTGTTAQAVVAQEGSVSLVKVHMQSLLRLDTATLVIQGNPSRDVADSEPVEQNTQVNGNVLKAGGLHSYNKVLPWIFPLKL